MSELTKRERAALAESGVVVEVANVARYKHKRIVWRYPDGREVCNWLLWKCACVKGGKTVRLALDERRKGQYWKLVHRSRYGKRNWHSQRERGRLADLVNYAIRHDLLRTFLEVTT